MQSVARQPSWVAQRKPVRSPVAILCRLWLAYLRTPDL